MSDENGRKGITRVRKKPKKEPYFITDFTSPFFYNAKVIGDKGFQKMAMFALFGNPFANTTLSRPRLKNDAALELKEDGRLGLLFSSHFADHLWTHNNLEIVNPEWEDPAVSSQFSKTFFYEFVYMSKSGSPSGRIGNFFIHFRNAFAHGHFGTIRIHGETFWFLEDNKPAEKGGSVLTARICISEKFVLQLITLVEEYVDCSEKGEE